MSQSWRENLPGVGTKRRTPQAWEMRGRDSVAPGPGLTLPGCWLVLLTLWLPHVPRVPSAQAAVVCPVVSADI